jgi:hypothetical protein
VRWLLPILVACGGTRPVATPPQAACVLPAPAVLLHEGAVIFERWDLPLDGPWLGPSLPADAPYTAYRTAIRNDGAELARPISDPHVAETDAQKEIWRREDLNADLAAPHVRPIHCLEAALFARQHARFDQLTHPTEFISVILKKDRVLRVYFGASDQLFPPKRVYGLDEARRDTADGWQAVAYLHNHTIQKRAGKHALGTPTPSTNDVHLLRNVTPDIGPGAIWVTNGVFTADVPHAELPKFHAPP